MFIIQSFSLAKPSNIHKKNSLEILITNGITEAFKRFSFIGTHSECILKRDIYLQTSYAILLPE